MKSLVLAAYHRLPTPLRSLAASLRGYYLQYWRYGPETDRLITEAVERETWDSEQWQAWQQERLAYVLQRAATRAPYYRQSWERRRRNGDRAAWDLLENWPLLSKEEVREQPRAFVADDCDTRSMFEEHTSGTSGKPLTLWWSRQTVRAWYALFEARWRNWYGVSRNDRWAILGGQVVAPVSQTKPPFWVWNQALNQLYMSSYHLSPGLLPAYLDAIAKYRITYLWGYTSSLYALALEALRLGRADLRLTVAIANAEPVFDYQRRVIETAFQCPLRETYGMAEIVAAAGECAHGKLHLWPEVGVIELNGEERLDDGMRGELVCTGLFNADMPLIRYRLGDQGTLPGSEAACDCGRSLPIITSIGGRVDDTLFTADGRIIGRLDPVFKTSLPIHEAQIIQETLQQVRVRFVPAAGYEPLFGQSIIDQIQARMGAIEVILEPVKEIPKEPTGKFRAVVCKLPTELQEALRREAC